MGSTRVLAMGSTGVLGSRPCPDPRPRPTLPRGTPRVAARAGHRERCGALGGLQLRPGPGGPRLVRHLAGRRNRYGPGPGGGDRGLPGAAEAVGTRCGATARRGAAPHRGRHGRSGPHGVGGPRDVAGVGGPPGPRDGSEWAVRAVWSPRSAEMVRGAQRWSARRGKQAGRLTGFRARARYFSANFCAPRIPWSNDPPTPVRPALKGPQGARAPYVDWPLPRGALPCTAHECNAS